MSQDPAHDQLPPSACLAFVNAPPIRRTKGGPLVRAAIAKAWRALVDKQQCRREESKSLTVKDLDCLFADGEKVLSDSRARATGCLNKSYRKLRLKKSRPPPTICNRTSFAAATETPQRTSRSSHFAWIKNSHTGRNFCKIDTKILKLYRTLQVLPPAQEPPPAPGSEAVAPNCGKWPN